MELLQLKYFCDAAVCENFSLTARKFSVPASDISQSVKRLEQELGVSLFDRRANRIILNERGRMFFSKVRSALALLDGARADLCDRGADRIKICVNSNRRIVMKTLERFRCAYPSVDIVIRYSFSEREDFDLAILSDELPSVGFSCEKIISEKVLLAMSRENSLAELEEISADLLEKESFVCMDEGSNLYRTTVSICNALGFTPRIAIRADDPFYVRKCVEHGMGVSFVPAFSWKGFFSDSIVLRSVGEFHRDTYLCKNTKEMPSMAVEHFVSMLFEEVRADV